MQYLRGKNSLSMAAFVTHLRVRHYEMDALGHVNNAVYQHYLEQAAIEHSEHLGFGPAWYQEMGGAFVMRRVAIDYLRPAVAGDLLCITTWLQDVKGTRATRHYEIRKRDEPDLLVTAEALWVWVDASTLRPRAIPKVILRAFEQQA
jgi:acyl-CoA thioester hydrolase